MYPAVIYNLYYKVRTGEIAMYKVLIVDDEAELRNGIANYFPWDDFGFTVAASADNGKDALQIIDENQIDVVLTDIVMPDMGGIELAAEISKRRLPIKILFLSGYADFSYAQSAIAYGVKQYIVKPTKYNDLRDTFSRLKVELDNERFRHIRDDSEIEPHNVSNTYYDKIISSVKTYIKENVQTITLDSAAGHVHLNPYYLSNLFKLCTGTKFSEYVIKAKMKKAAGLLDDINLKIYDISLMVGYSNPNNFARTFKSVYNMTPKEYRNRKC
jgi:two-component system response regulator YesN